MSLVQPPTPAVDNYPTTSPYASQIQASRERFLQEISSDDGWTELGEKQGVTLSKKSIEGNPVPIVRGEAVVENVEPWDFLAGVIRAQELRKQWDPRYETGVYLQRFSQSEVVFHALTKGTRFVAAPRDIVGVQKDFVESDGTYIVVQTSIETDLAQELPKTTRATLNLAGWQFKPEGANTRVVYLVQVALNGSIPSMLANAVANETPLCVGRARDVFYKHGFAPHLKFRGDEKAGGIVYQVENYEPDARKYICTISTGSAPGDSIEILYDTNKVYTSGVKVTVDGDASAVAVEDNGQGVVRVESKEAGKTVTIVLSK